MSDRYGDVDDLDEGLGELEEDESSAQDEPDPDAVLSKRKIFTDKSDWSMRADASSVGSSVVPPLVLEGPEQVTATSAVHPRSI